MKRKICFGMMSLLLALNSIAQIEMKTKKDEVKVDSTQGFFVKNGSMKLSTLECYDFDNLIIAFNIDESFFDYDLIKVELGWGIDGNMDMYKTAQIDKVEFAKRFTKKDKYAYFSIFKTNDPEEVSNWDFTKAHLQYTPSNASLNDSKLIAWVSGVKRTTKKVYRTASDGSVVETNEPAWETPVRLHDLSLPMKNRIKANPIGYKIGKVPKLQTTGNCYQ